MLRLLRRVLPGLLLLLPALAGICAHDVGMPSVGRMLWLKADSLPQANGEPLTTWADAGGNGRQATFTPLNGKGVAPILVRDAVNGRPAVRFAGNSMLRVAALPLGAFTIAVVLNTRTSGEMIYQHGAGKDGCSLTTGAKNTLAVVRGGTRTVKDVIGEAAGAWAAETKAPVVVLASFDGTDDGLQLDVNGSRQLMTTSLAGDLAAKNVVTQPFDLGARAPGSDMQFHGDIAEVVIFDHILPKAAHQILFDTLMKKYIPPLSYTDPTRVNLLEQWNSDGSYLLTATASAGEPLNAVSCCAGGAGWNIGNAQNQPENTITARFTFPQLVVLGQVMVQWRERSHSPTNYTFRDQQGVIVQDVNGPYDGTPRFHTFTPRTSQYLEITCNPATTAVNTFECVRLGAFLAKGQLLPLTGTTNILYEEDSKMQVSGNGYDPCWYDHTAAMMKPAAEGGNLTLHFSREYELLGAFLSQYDSTRFLANTCIEISKDGQHWLQVYASEHYHFRGEAAPRDKGYITWDVSPDTDLHARWARLSWGANPMPVEITEWQIFGR